MGSDGRSGSSVDPAAPDALPVVVVGGNRGLGLAIVQSFREDGRTVIATYRTQPPADGPSLHCDVTDEATVGAMADEVCARWGAPTAVVINAGIAHRGLTMRMGTETFDEVVDTDLRGAFLVARAFLPAMTSARTGALVFVASASAHWGTAGVAAYAASKSGLVGLCRSIAREVGKRGVRANVLVPGLLENAVGEIPDAADWVRQTPARRVGTMAECAAVARFLGSSASRGITGAVVPVDGGFGIGLV